MSFNLYMKIKTSYQIPILFKSKIQNQNKPVSINCGLLPYPSAENLQGYISHAKIKTKDEDIKMNTQEKYIELRETYGKELAPKKLQAELTAWDFYINSTNENLEKMTKAEDELFNLYKDEEMYKAFSAIQNEGLNNKHLDKQLKNIVKLYDEELNSGELKKSLRTKESKIAAKYNSYVPKIDNREVSKAEINKILETEKNVDLRKKAYDAKIGGGDLIANDLVELVKMRNEFARSQGYKNFFEYQLKEEFDVDIEQLDDLLSDVFENAKDANKGFQANAKRELSEAFGISANDLKNYHYGLLMDNEPAKKVNNELKTKEQVVDIAINAYKNMGYDIDNMPIILDLFPRKNKNTHGFCFGIEPGKDSRILANLTNNTNSLDTLCHELGHSVYNLGIATNMPYVEQETTPAMTEAVAMMMGDLPQQEDILKDFVRPEILKEFKDNHKKSEAKFINHSIQIINFEREMYKNPDQNLGKLWHDMKCKYKGRSENEDIDNEWATVPHYLSHPVYYQNYFRAALIKAQMYKHLTKELGLLTENKQTAQYLNENLFRYGLSVDENDLIEQFTGEKLSSKAFCDSLKK